MIQTRIIKNCKIDNTPLWGEIVGDIDNQKDLSNKISNEIEGVKEWVEGKNYLTEHQHIKTINGEVLVGDGDIEIGGSESVIYEVGSADIGFQMSVEQFDQIASDFKEGKRVLVKDCSEQYNKGVIYEVILYSPAIYNFERITLSMNRNELISFEKDFNNNVFSTYTDFLTGSVMNRRYVNMDMWGDTYYGPVIDNGSIPSLLNDVKAERPISIYTGDKWSYGQFNEWYLLTYFKQESETYESYSLYWSNGWGIYVWNISRNPQEGYDYQIGYQYSEFATSADLTALSNQISEVEGKIPSLEGYATENYVNGQCDGVFNALDSRITSEVSALEDKIPSLEGYATQDYVQEIDAARKEWVIGQNYLTEHQDISGKADISYVDGQCSEVFNALDSRISSEVSALEDKIPSLEGYATQDFVGNLFQEAIQAASDAQDNAERWMVDYINDSDFATKSYVDDSIWSGTEEQWDALDESKKNNIKLAVIW